MSPSNFQPLDGVAGVEAIFIPRIVGIDTATDRETALSRLRSRHDQILARGGIDPAGLATAQQIHGAEVASVGTGGRSEGADGLVTGCPRLALAIYVADCAAVYLADRHGRAVGLIHSGRTGTEQNITGRAIALLEAEFSVEPADLIVQISPCIRPPLYQTDFAAQIAGQAQALGVKEIRDDRICTGSHLDLYYSYRMEGGRTGRMLAVLQLNS